MRSIFLGVLCFWSLSVSAYAAKGCSAESSWRVSEASACLQKKDVGCAKLKLEKVFEREPECSSALFIKGWILQYYDDKAEAGQAMQDRAVELDPELNKFWDNRGRAIESNLSSQAFSNFDLQFHGAENRGKAWDAVRYLNEMRSDLAALFGEFPPRRIPVIVFTSSEFVDAWNAPFVGGFFDRRDGKIRIRVDEMRGGAEEFQLRARHEMTHAFLYQLYPKTVPGWFSEGVAEYCALRGVSHGFWQDQRLEQIRKSLRGYPWINLEGIERCITQKKGTVREMGLSYLESEALVIWVAKDKGESWIPRILKHLRESGGTFEESYRTLFGVTPDRDMERLRHHWE
jgi:hypothetical protein